MNNELYQHKRSDTVKWAITFILLAVLLVGMACGIYVAVKNNNAAVAEEPTQEAQEPEDVLGTTFDQHEFLALASSEAVVAADNTVSKTLTATVYPTDAKNKLIDWSIAWSETASRASENVENYVTVVTNSDGSNVAIVTCFKSFMGDEIIITATSRAGGYSATCTVSFLGTPSSLEIVESGGTNITDGSLSLYQIDCGTNHTWNIDLDNVFGVVGDTYGDYAVVVEAFGSIKTVTTMQDFASGATSTTNNTYALTVQEIDGAQVALFNTTSTLHTYASVKVENGKLVVEALLAPSAFKSSFILQGGMGPTGVANTVFDSYVDGKEPYIKITVTENNSGVSQSIYVRTKAVVTNVALDSTTMSF